MPSLYFSTTPTGSSSTHAILQCIVSRCKRAIVEMEMEIDERFDVVREVEIIPRRGWGGEGALGAVLGFGALHRLPVGLGEEIQAPGERLFEAEQRASMEKASTEEGVYFVPAESERPIQQKSPPFVNPNVFTPPMVSPSAAAGGTSVSGAAVLHGKRSRHRAGGPPNKAFDDIFQEGAKKSQEQDFVPSRKGTPVAPPPKLGEPDGVSTAGSQRMDPSPDSVTAEDLGEPSDTEAT